MTSRSVFFALLSITSLALGWQLRSWYPPQAGSEASASSPGRAEFEHSQARVAQLEAELAAARADQAALQNRLAAQGETQPKSSQQTATRASSQAQASTSSSSIPELTALTAAQIPLATAEAIRAQIGQNRLAMLRLRDQAEREGWINTQRYAEELRKLLDPSQGIRERFGDEVYDRYLYASEKPNRVLATAVYPESIAAAAGIQPGDTVLSYASTNIYSMQELQQATREGQAGESVLMVLQRDGTSFAITLPRGPIGIELKMTSQTPE